MIAAPPSLSPRAAGVRASRRSGDKTSLHFWEIGRSAGRRLRRTVTINPATNQFGLTLITLTVTDAGGATNSTSFLLTVQAVNDPPVLAFIPDQISNEGGTLSFTNAATDIDQPPQTLTFSLVSGPAGATNDPVSGVFTWTPSESQGPGTNTIVVAVTDNGVPNQSVTRSFSVIVREVNTAPVLTVPATQTLDEFTTLDVSATATDSDAPTNTLTFELVSGPAGLTVASNGAVAWTPDEAQGLSTNDVTIRVFDNGVPSLAVTQSFSVIVREVNTAPVLTVPDTQVLDELTALNVSATATDSDVPTNTLTFELVSGPSGLTVSSNGAIAWTPDESQGPSTNDVTVRVFDNGIPSLAVTQSFSVIVREVNTAPVLTLPDPQVLDELTALNVSATANDSDRPTNTLTFELVSGPPGLTVASNGNIAWTPDESQGPSTNDVTLRVFDNGIPSLAVTQSFSVIVREVNTAPVFAPTTNLTVQPGTTVSVALLAIDQDLPANAVNYSLVSPPNGAGLNPTNGLFTWTPTGNQQVMTNLITAVATDDGVPALSSTNFFTITVLPLPVIQSITKGTNGFNLGWSSIPGTSYGLQFRTNLTSGTWTDLPGEVIADTTNTSITIPFTAENRAYYRIKVLP